MRISSGRNRAGRIARDGGTGGHVARHHGTRADDGVVAHGDAGQQDRAAADPDVAADVQRPARFETGGADFGGAMTAGGAYLAGRDAARAMDL